ncbi:site-2 protease family protein [Patescibacteria group bacterium]|nr:site-2 protease family protein [Patescibacteria group bacterium]
MSSLEMVFFLIVIIPSAILHEYAHAWMADRLGDPTPRLAGRLTINPVPHIDPWGTLFLPFLLFFVSGGGFLFAYAKPVPFNPLALRAQKWGSALVGGAGPVINLLVAFVLGLVVQLVNLGSLTNFLTIVIYANILLAVFNLVPIPPLDGSKILYVLLPDKWYGFKLWLEKYGIFVLFFFILFLFDWLRPIMEFLLQLAVAPGSLF